MTTRDFSNKHEKGVAKRLGGVKTSNSGATPFTKGDVIVGDCLIECKTKMTPSKSHLMQEKWLKDLETERIGMGKRLCALAFNFEPNGRSYYIIDEKTMKLLLWYLENEQEENN